MPISFSLFPPQVQVPVPVAPTPYYNTFYVPGVGYQQQPVTVVPGGIGCGVNIGAPVVDVGFGGGWGHHGWEHGGFGHRR